MIETVDGFSTAQETDSKDMLGFKKFFITNGEETIDLVEKKFEPPVVSLNEVTYSFSFFNPYSALTESPQVKFLWFVGKDPPNPNKAGPKSFVGTRQPAKQTPFIRDALLLKVSDDLYYCFFYAKHAGQPQIMHIGVVNNQTPTLKDYDCRLAVHSAKEVFIKEKKQGGKTVKTLEHLESGASITLGFFHQRSLEESLALQMPPNKEPQAVRV